MIEKTFEVSQNGKGLRLDKFLAGQLGFLSRTKIHALIDKDMVLVDGDAKKASFHLKVGQKVEIKIADEKKELKPFDFAVKIIYEDNDIIVIDKPGGLVVHPPQKNYYKTLVNALINLKKELSDINALRPGVVHRLDKETSGVMVMAKNNKAHHALVEQFKQRSVKKVYVAIAWGKPSKNKLSVDLPLGRDIKNRLKMKVSFLRSKTAHSQIETIEALEGATYLRIIPSTGRMHQIRVHLKFLELPIVGDKKYGVKDDFNELFLHAKELSFMHPVTAEPLKFSSPVPERFKEFIKNHHLKNN